MTGPKRRGLAQRPRDRATRTGQPPAEKSGFPAPLPAFSPRDIRKEPRGGAACTPPCVLPLRTNPGPSLPAISASPSSPGPPALHWIFLQTPLGPGTPAPARHLPADPPVPAPVDLGFPGLRSIREPGICRPLPTTAVTPLVGVRRCQLQPQVVQSPAPPLGTLQTCLVRQLFILSRLALKGLARQPKPVCPCGHSTCQSPH